MHLDYALICILFGSKMFRIRLTLNYYFDKGLEIIFIIQLVKDALIILMDNGTFLDKLEI